MLTKKLCKDSARSVQDKTKVCFCFFAEPQPIFLYSLNLGKLQLDN